jgi:FkbM family methyltransferase
MSSLERQLAWYAEVLPLDGEVIVDGGANVGLLSEFFATANGGRNRVISVEPIEENALQIERRIAEHGAGDRWTVARCALSDRDGEVSVRLGSGEQLAFNSVVVDPRSVRASALASLRRVACRSLASLCADATVVKLDVEGHEYEVLDAALPVMRAVKAWAIELHMREGRPLSKVIGAIRRSGFRVFGAGQRRADPTGPWLTAEVPHELEWSAIGAAKADDGRDTKMLHIVAR